MYKFRSIQVWKNCFIHRLKRRYIDKNALPLIGLPWQTNMILIIYYNSFCM